VTDTDERLFLRVVEAGSLKAAAAFLGKDASTLSRRVAALEERLGVKLLVRSTRRTTPTDAGQRYYEGLRDLVAQQEALEAEVSRTTETPHGQLRVTAPVDFGARFVVPVLARLQESAPDLVVECVLGSGYLDLAEHGLDVAVRVGKLPDSALIARRLGAVPRVLVEGRATSPPGADRPAPQRSRSTTSCSTAGSRRAGRSRWRRRRARPSRSPRAGAPWSASRERGARAQRGRRTQVTSRPATTSAWPGNGAPAGKRGRRRAAAAP